MIESGTLCSLMDRSCIYSSVCFTYWNCCDKKNVQVLPRLGPLKLKCFSVQGIFLSVVIDNLESRKCPSWWTAQCLWLWPLPAACFTIFPLLGRCLWTLSKDSLFQSKNRLKNRSLTFHLRKLCWEITFFRH